MENIQFSFKDRTAIVTGGTRGIGKAITEAYLRNGARVIATYARNDDAANAFKNSLGAHAEKLELRKFDVANYDEVEAFYKKLDADFGAPQFLVNNSGIRKDTILGMMSSDDWNQVIDTNLTGTFNMSKFAVKAMMTERFGRIISITSPIGKHGMAGQANYGASKAGQIGFTRSLAKEVARRGITVNCVSPGFIETELLGDLSEDLKKGYKESVPMRRFGTADEVASAVLFLSSKEAAYITGSVIEVTGGF